MEKNSLSCPRVSSSLAAYKILELQLAAQLQKVVSKFYIGDMIFPSDSLQSRCAVSSAAFLLIWKL